MTLATVYGAFEMRAIGSSLDRLRHTTRSMLMILVLLVVSFEDSIRSSGSISDSLIDNRQNNTSASN
ncbi:hypothetical protein [Chamaesiphon sp. VAR_48_metabat_135_sub]|uniref:hypothetical protein n=1 Tax=Chamaesiphon sp. VAR_48_metabat_135_sub TaxID=2964699 RepID=UPI00286D11EC|nr:hypothetical protein [Chamaesiphon sp. VAR_48_metabat_135_sub]